MLDIFCQFWITVKHRSDNDYDVAAISGKLCVYFLFLCSLNATLPPKPEPKPQAEPEASGDTQEPQKVVI